MWGGGVLGLGLGLGGGLGGGRLVVWGSMLVRRDVGREGGREGFGDGCDMG